MKILICGLGSIGYRHLEILKSFKGIKVYTLRSGKSKLKKISIADKEFTDISEVLKEQIDGVLITNPTSEHVSSAITFAKKEIPIFIEKPLGSSIKGIKKLRAICKKNNVPVLMGYNLIFHPAITKIKDLIEKKDIGNIICSKAHFGTYMPDWHPWENYKESYASLKEMGGGVTLTSIHEINFITYLFGDVSIFKALEIKKNTLDIETEEGIEILFQHSNNIVSNIHLNFFQIPNRRYFEIIGDAGTIIWDFWSSFVEVRTKNSAKKFKLGTNAIDLLNYSYKNQMKHFVDVCKRKSQPIIDLDKGIYDLKLVLSILKKIKRR